MKCDYALIAMPRGVGRNLQFFRSESVDDGAEAVIVQAGFNRGKHVRKLALFAATGMALTATAASAQTFVSSANPTPTLLGTVVAGQAYTVSTTGISDLFDAFNGGLGLTFTANGIPTYNFPAPYAGFLPNGSSFDPTSGITCAGGPTLLCGALIGAFVPTIGATPTSYFALGSSYAFTAASSGFLVGLVSDVNIVNAYGDNGQEGFTVTFASATSAVPEPATWGMMIAGFGLIGGVLRARKAARAVSYA